MKRISRLLVGAMQTHSKLGLGLYISMHDTDL